MYHKSLKRNMGLSVLILVLVSLSIGYAIISSNLELNGNAKIANMAWQVYFDNVKVTDGSTGLSVPTLSADKTSVSFTTSFTKPTDYYDFTLDLINAGTIAAKVDSVVLSGLTAEQDVYANYRVTYVGGGEISAGDTLNPGETREIRVRLEMDPDVDGSLLPSTDATLALSARINFVQGEEVKYLMDVIKKEAVLDSIASTYVTSSSGIDFSAVSSDTNGKGVYTLTSSASDKYPIYYYRGAVGNNNVIFGGFCWKMVRTTETGGIKLIYNGSPTDGTCTLAKGSYNEPLFGTVTIGSSKYNATETGAPGAGYMYGNDMMNVIHVQTIEEKIIFGKNITYSDGYYILHDIITYDSDSYYAKSYPYTCLTTSDKCSIAYALINAGGNMLYELTNGKDFFEQLESILSGSTNKISSTLKEFIDQWYENNLISSQNFLEDSVWCNDRSVIKEFGSSITAAAYQRFDNGNVSYNCSCQNDSFTVYGENGNGNLKHPIAVLTLDEIVGAGRNNTSNFLFNNFSGPVMWTMTPYSFYNGGPPTYIFNFNVNGVNAPDVNKSYLVRPAISLKVGTTYTSGTGTSSDPYVI